MSKKLTKSDLESKVKFHKKRISYYKKKISEIEKKEKRIGFKHYD